MCVYVYIQIYIYIYIYCIYICIPSKLIEETKENKQNFISPNEERKREKLNKGKIY